MRKRAFGIISIALALGGAGWLYWVLEVPHFDWPRGESGLIAVAAAGLWGAAAFVAGLIIGVVGVVRPVSRAWAVGGVVLNVAALVVIGLSI